jgi:ribonuclease HI
VGEVIACWKALEAAVTHGISRVQLETESVLLHKAMLSSELDQVSPGVIFKDIRALVRKSFSHFDCFHISRNCKSSVHEITVLGLS